MADAAARRSPSNRWSAPARAPRKVQTKRLPAHAVEDQAHTGAFLMEVDGVAVGRFTEVTGLEVQVEMQQISEGGTNGFVHHIPGRVSWPNLVLRRAITKDDNLLSWFQKAGPYGTNEMQPTTAALTLINGKGQRLKTWNLIDAVPVRWTGPTMANANEDRLMEELEIAHHGFDVQTFG